jgi:hypothetical protein
VTDHDILQFAKDFRAAILGDGDSAWMCAAISGPLCAALNVQGVYCHLVESDLGECNHVFIQLDDGRVLDPTADQFNWCSRVPLPGVYLGEKTLIHDGGPCKDFAQAWMPLLKECKRLAPDYTGTEVGRMVRAALMTLPKEMIQMPDTSAEAT